MFNKEDKLWRQIEELAKHPSYPYVLAKIAFLIRKFKDESDLEVQTKISIPYQYLFLLLGLWLKHNPELDYAKMKKIKPIKRADLAEENSAFLPSTTKTA